MAAKFNKKLAKKIANKELIDVLDFVLRDIDSPFSLVSEGVDFFDIFEDELIQLGIHPTDKRLDTIMDCYDQMRDKLVNDIRKKYCS